MLMLRGNRIRALLFGGTWMQGENVGGPSLALVGIKFLGFCFCSDVL
jgi:hypothetical protein